MVKVFPVPVCPYAKIVPLYPSRTLSMMGRAVSSKIVYCLLFRPKVESKVKSLIGFKCVFLGSGCFIVIILDP
jgi:hypothetical protein